MAYVGRFAPSPTGPLHAGSVVAALASWLDARAHGGRWLVRIEDVDGPRCPPGTDHLILGQLSALGLHPDEPPVWQSQRSEAYQAVLDRLQTLGWIFACACSRSDIEAAQIPQLPQLPQLQFGRSKQKFVAPVYPGTCRHGIQEVRGSPPRAARAWRMRSCSARGEDITLTWSDRRMGTQTQNLTQAVGDFVLKRSDGCWAYQLAVVVDDAAQGITDVVRGEDLADNTARQIHLQQVLGWPRPRYWHGPLVRAADGHKLSKQNGAVAVDLRDPLPVLQTAGQVLGLSPTGDTPATWLASAVQVWQAGLVA